MQTKQCADILPSMMCLASASTYAQLSTPVARSAEIRLCLCLQGQDMSCAETDAWLHCTTVPKRAPRHFSPRYGHGLQRLPEALLSITSAPANEVCLAVASVEPMLFP